MQGHLAQVTRTGTSAAEERASDGDSSLAAWWRRRQLESAPKSARVDPDILVRLTAELERQAAALLPQEQQLTQMSDFLRGLQHQIDHIMEGAKVLPFGSAVNGFWTAQSDVDVCVRVPRASTRPAQIKVLREIADALSKVEKYYIEPRYGAQVPILHWAPRRPGMVACDISVNNVLAVVNSRLLGQYVRLDERLRTLGLCLKAWAQARGINDRSRGTVSSFALVLMLIHFLQHRDPPALPSLQDIAFSRSLPPDFVNGVDCRYCADPAMIAAELEYLRGVRPPNQEDVGLLLLEFFRYFGHEYRHGIIRIRDTRSQLPPGDETGYYLVVDNPFEVGRDVANVDGTQHDIIKKEFQRAWGMLRQGRSFQEVLRNPNVNEAVARRRPLQVATNERSIWKA